MISFDCEQIESVKLKDKMDRIPMYVEGRLAQTVDTDFWTFKKIASSRFIVSRSLKSDLQLFLFTKHCNDGQIFNFSCSFLSSLPIWHHS